MSIGWTRDSDKSRLQRYAIPTKLAGGFALSVFGLGTYQMGGGLERDWDNDDGRDIAAIQAAVTAGVTHIDTAEIYAGGHCERLVGRAIAGLDRSRLFIASKVYPTHLHFDDVIAACRGSLERLGISQLDLYLVHMPNPEIPLAETVRAMDWLVEHEMVRFIGVSNFDLSWLEAARALTKYGIVTNQIHYSLVARAYEDNGTLEYCRTHGILVTAYRPIGKFGELARSGHLMLDRISAKYRKTPAQIAVNWVLSKPNVVALVKTSRPDHLRDDLGALGWQLQPEDVAELDTKFPRGETINVPQRPPST